MSDTGTQGHRNLAAAALAIGLACALLLIDPTPAHHYSLEARQRTALAADVISGASRGTQGLVGSLHLAPLPTIVVVLIGLIPFVPITPLLNSVAAAGAAALLAAYVHAVWRAHGVHPALRYSAVVAIMLLPPVAVSVRAGATSMVFVALTVCACGALGEWLRTASLRQLSLSAIFLGLAVITRWQGLVLAAAATGVVALGAAVHRRGWSYVEGTSITYAVPGAYTALLWIGGNWLVLGNPLFFLRSLGSAAVPGPHGAWSVLAADCPWALIAIMAGFCCSVQIAGAVLRRSAWRHPADVAACCALAVLVGVAWIGRLPLQETPAPSDARRVATLLSEAYPNGVFIVTGYVGYEFTDAAGADPENRWVHQMHLRPENVDKILADYPGCDVYLLVHAGLGQERWDRVGLTWADGDRIPEHYLFVRMVGDWAVFEILRP
ncbi:MAG: hypothetical protein GXY85_11855 [Candidatus Brocadiaceae bacterium]|nr:hypothetical protein [Candidatus Brocadiaceae bacterium]